MTLNGNIVGLSLRETIYLVAGACAGAISATLIFGLRYRGNRPFLVFILVLIALIQHVFLIALCVGESKYL
jgi:hypothetical protein